MDEQLKRRLVGATVLVALAIIFLPMFLGHKPVARHVGQMTAIPVEPPRNFDPSLLQDIPVEKQAPVRETPSVSTDPESQVKTAPATILAPVVAAKPEASPQPPAAPGKKPESKTEKTAQQQAEKTSPIPKPSSLTAWVVQVASLSSRESAEKLVQKLRKAGLDTMNPTAVTVGGKRYYRVQVGPELDKKRAQKLLPRINKISGTKGQVVRYP